MCVCVCQFVAGDSGHSQNHLYSAGSSFEMFHLRADEMSMSSNCLGGSKVPLLTFSYLPEASYR